jgi:hypothetical protein
VGQSVGKDCKNGVTNDIHTFNYYFILGSKLPVQKSVLEQRTLLFGYRTIGTADIAVWIENDWDSGHCCLDRERLGQRTLLFG